jgi:hypothetical protein
VRAIHDRSAALLIVYHVEGLSQYQFCLFLRGSLHRDPTVSAVGPILDTGRADVKIFIAMLTIIFFYSLIKQSGAIITCRKGIYFYYHFASSLMESIMYNKCRKRATQKR